MSNVSTRQAYALLKSLQGNAPGHDVELKYVDEFHHIVTMLEEASGTDLTRFRIPNSELRQIEVGSNYLEGTVDYSRERYCDPRFFKLKVDALLMLFAENAPPLRQPSE